MRLLHVQIWSDLACPWCYVGKRRFEQALAALEDRVRAEVTWRSFELDPAAPAVAPAEPYVERLAQKYGSSRAEAQAMIDRMTSVGAGEGIAFRFDRVRPGNTFDAHRLLHLALERGCQHALEERLLRAYLTESEALGDRAALLRLAAEVGLQAAEVREVLDGDRYRVEVRADEGEAQRLGIHAVPFFVLGGRYAVSGAQSVELFTSALSQAAEEVGEPVAVGGGAAACGPDGCAVPGR